MKNPKAAALQEKENIGKNYVLNQNNWNTLELK